MKGGETIYCVIVARGNADIHANTSTYQASDPVEGGVAHELLDGEVECEVSSAGDVEADVGERDVEVVRRDAELERTVHFNRRHLKAKEEVRDGKGLANTDVKKHGLATRDYQILIHYPTCSNSSCFSKLRLYYFPCKLLWRPSVGKDMIRTQNGRYRYTT